MNNVAYALLMTLFAGMATGVGSAIAFVCRRTNTRFLAVALGLSAGVMLYVSFMELMPLSSHNLVAYCTSIGREHLGGWLAAAAFFGGIGLIGLIDKLVPSFENPHEPRRIEDMAKGPSEPASPAGDLCADGPGDKNGNDFDPKFRALHRMGVMSALAIAIHNFPEGLATFAAAAESPAIGWPVAVAVAIHNIPEGIAVSVPLYYATGSRKKAFVWSLLSGLAEPLGAVLGWLILMPFFTPWVSGALFGVVAGIMVFISLDELLPSAQAYGEHHASIWGLVAGMAVMAVSLLIFS